MLFCKPKIFQLLLLDAHIDAHFEEHRQLFHQVQLLNLGVYHSLSWVDVLLADQNHLGGKGHETADVCDHPGSEQFLYL